MFLSQKIAKDPKFLVSASTTDDRSMFDIRVRVMNSVKFIVGSDQFYVNYNGEGKHTPYRDLVMNEQRLLDRTKMYDQFSKLPFKSFFIENDRFGALIEKTANDTVMITTVLNAEEKGGIVTSITSEYPLLDGSFSPVRDDGKAGFHIHSDLMYELCADGLDRNTKVEYMLLALQIAEILLFLNARNSLIHKYKPTKVENSKIPKPLLSKYEYHVLDIYRDHPVYLSQKSVEDALFCPPTEAIQRRMHFVRGHFKQKKNGLFWWNAFVRNARNADLGFVNKDYRLNNTDQLEKT